MYPKNLNNYNDSMKPFTKVQTISVNLITKIVYNTNYLEIIPKACGILCKQTFPDIAYNKIV